MALPYRVAIDASNQPTAAQNYEHGSTPLTGMVDPASSLVDGEAYILLAEEADGDGAPAGAWEICRAIWNNAATDNFGSRTLRDSSTGSLIDWSSGGVDATPRLRVLDRDPILHDETISAGSAGMRPSCQRRLSGPAPRR